MALVFFTGMNGISTATLARRFVTVGGSVGATGRYGQGLTVTGAGALVARGLPTALATVVLGLSIKFVAGDASIGFYDSSIASNHVSIDWDESDETVTVTLPGGGAFTSALGSVPVDTWVFLEVLVTVSNTVGVVTLRLNGTEIYAGTSLDTRASTGTTIDSFTYYSASGTAVIDCVYVNDTTGAAPHNGFLGVVRCDGVVPSADSTPTDWIGSGAVTNESRIDDGNTPDDDSTFNESATVGDQDLFTLAGFTAPSRYVFGYYVRAMTKATAADGREVAPLHVDGATNTTGTALALTTSYEEAELVIEESLTRFATATAAETAINAMKIGYELAN